MKTYKQCKLACEDMVLTSWIEERGAKVGARVDIPATDATWLVTEVFDVPAMSEAMLKEHKALNRHSLPSVEPIR